MKEKKQKNLPETTNQRNHWEIFKCSMILSYQKAKVLFSLGTSPGIGYSAPGKNLTFYTKQLNNISSSKDFPAKPTDEDSKQG